MRGRRGRVTPSARTERLVPPACDHVRATASRPVGRGGCLLDGRSRGRCLLHQLELAQAVLRPPDKGVKTRRPKLFALAALRSATPHISPLRCRR